MKKSWETLDYGCLHCVVYRTVLYWAVDAGRRGSKPDFHIISLQTSIHQTVGVYLCLRVYIFYPYYVMLVGLKVSSLQDWRSTQLKRLETAAPVGRAMFFQIII